MAHDQETYRRGRNSALLGGIVQLMLALFVLLLGLWSHSRVIYSAGWHVLGGLPVWIVLWLIYHQHRLERIESLEAEQLSRKDREAAAMFADHADDLDLARRRLEKLYKWGLSVVSLITSTYLIGLGLYLLYQDGVVRTLPGHEKLIAVVDPRASVMVLMLATVGFGFVAFAVARYVSGMTTVREWQLLRGGAGYLMGNFLVALLLVIATVTLAMGSNVVFNVLARAVPSIMVLIGVEILLTFLLSAYRPRRPGEIPRPAFDSRVLGLMTSPESLGKIISETVNYQFGFEITRSWFYQLLGRAITPLIIFAIVVLLLFSTVVIVQPYEQAVITVNGRIQRIAGPGLQFKPPWPIGGAERYDVGRIHRFSVGSIAGHGDATDDGHDHGDGADDEGQGGEDEAVLWTVKHTLGQEDYLITAPTRAAALVAGEASESVPSVSLLAGEVVVQYAIRRDEGLRQYVNAAADADKLIAAIADRRVGDYYLSNDIDTLLARGRFEAGDILRRQIQADSDQLELGLEVVFVSLVGIHPPQEMEVAASFQQQIEAVLDQQTEIEIAERRAIARLAAVAGSSSYALEIDQAIQDFESLKQDRDAGGAELEKQITEQQVAINELLADASGEVAKRIYEARAYRWQRGITERAAAERFSAELKAYRKAPRYFKAKRRLEAMAEALAQARKIVIGGDVKTPILDLDLKDSRSALTDMFLENDEE